MPCMNGIDTRTALPFGRAVSACRKKGVNLEEWAILHAEETSRNRAEFRFLVSLLPPSKKRKAQMAHEPSVHAPFNCFYTYYLFTIKSLFYCLLLFFALNM